MNSSINVIRQSNHRTHVAIAVVRIVRNQSTITEVRDALNARRNARMKRLTQKERAVIDRKYALAEHGYGH